jgi:predicted permease
VAQVAMALVLLTGSGLMLRSFVRLSSVDPGFEPVGVTAFDIALPRSRYPGADAVYRAQRTLLTELASAPGVSAAGAIDALPVAGGDRCIAVSVEAREALEPIGRGCPQVRFAAPGYFETMGIEVVSGRTFEHRDNDVRTAPLVVSRAMAENLWPGRDPTGRGVRLWGDGYYRVVGVVGDVRDDGLDRPAPGILYFSIVAAPGESMPPVNAMTLVVRGGGDVVETARRVVAGVDPDVPLAAVRTMEEVLSRSMIRTTFTLLMLGLAGALGLVLGVVGMYAVVSYAVSKRTAELGVRIALGAGRGALRWMVLAHAGLLTALGIAVGLALSLLGTRVLGSLLYGVTATDSPTLASASLVLFVVSLAAAWLPAHRATRIDPVAALREE